jgi:predicted metalloprotease with PDZ domain
VVTYQISFPRPGAHLAHVRLDFVAPPRTGADEPGCAIWMAAWTPGSYLVREYARNIRSLAVEVDGQPALAHKLGKDTWQIAARPGQRVQVDYTVYAHELSVRTAHHDATHAFLHPAQLFLLPTGVPGPFRVELELPAGWQAVSLAADPADEQRSPGRFALELPDLDTLLDTPIEAGDLQILQLPAPCTHVRVAVWGEPLPDLVLDRLVPVIAQVEATWPSRPYAHYTFIMHAVLGAGGGLEHLHGSVLGVDPERFAPALRRAAHVVRGPEPRAPEPVDADDGVLDFLELAAHELFHAWNGKRLRPTSLGPFDYQRENYTRELWLVEGVTSYYDRLCVLRSGQMPIQTFLKRLGEDLGRLAAVPGRLQQSLADSSFDAWIKLYRPQDDSPNASVSYYLKGSLVALELDLWLRSQRPEGNGLDDVLAALWRRSSAAVGDWQQSAHKIYASRGFTLEEFIDILTIEAGTPPPTWLRAAWERPGELDLSNLALVGLHLTEKPAEPGGLDLGLVLQDRTGAPWVQHVLAGSPAEHAGLAPGDELLAARRQDGPWMRLRTARAARVWDHLRPDEPVELLVSRRERVLTLGVRFAAARGLPQIERLPEAPESARNNFRHWARRSWNDT